MYSAVGQIMITKVVQPENTHHRGKHPSTADIMFDCFGFDQTSKAVANSTEVKQLNPSKINRSAYSGTSPDSNLICDLRHLISLHL